MSDFTPGNGIIGGIMGPIFGPLGKQIGNGVQSAVVDPVLAAKQKTGDAVAAKLAADTTQMPISEANKSVDRLSNALYQGQLPQIASPEKTPIAGINNNDPIKNPLPVFGDANNVTLNQGVKVLPDQLSEHKGFWDWMVNQAPALKSQGLTMYPFGSDKATPDQLIQLQKGNPNLWKQYILGAGKTPVGTIAPKQEAPPTLDIPEGPTGGSPAPEVTLNKEVAPEKPKENPIDWDMVLKTAKNTGMDLLGVLQAGIAGSNAGYQKRPLDFENETILGRRDKQNREIAAEDKKNQSEASKLSNQQEFQKQLAYLNNNLQSQQQAVQNDFTQKMATAKTDTEVQQAKLDRDAALQRIYAQSAAQKQNQLPAIPGSADRLGIR